MGYMGHVLVIDLTRQEIDSQPLDSFTRDLFFGGRGLGVAILCRHFADLQMNGRYGDSFKEVDPLSEDNVIIISTAPTTGTRMPTSGRIHMNFKSPLTGGYGSTNGGGKWGVDFKKNGFDVMVITGKAEKPVYIVVAPEGVQINDALSIQNLDAVDTRLALKERFTRRAQVLSIGEAGKKLVRFSAVMSDTGKAMGRGGAGAVWGSKNLYAIVAVSDLKVKIQVAHPESFDPENRKGAMYPVKLKMDMGKFTKREEMFGILAAMGSLGLLGMVNHYHQLIHNNMKDTIHRQEDIQKINGEALRSHFRTSKPGHKKIMVKKSACFNCPIVCKRKTTLLDENNQVIEKGEGPEFESTTLMGANLSIYDLVVITQANYLANRYGIDTISLGATIAAFFELSEYIRSKKRKLSSREKRLFADGEEFSKIYGDPGFGKPEQLIPLIHAIGRTQGIGKYLAQGSYRFCERYGHPEFSMSVKKMELPAYDPRTSFSQALCYEMNNRGGGHLEGGYTAPHAYCAGYAEWPANRIEGTPLISKNATLKNTVLDIIGACVYGSFSLSMDEYALLVNGVTGLEHNMDMLKELAQRTVTLERIFNYLCGIGSDQDWLPDRFYKETISTKDGYIVCNREEFAKMHRMYYHSLGWNDVGMPTASTLETLQIVPFVPSLYDPPI